MKTQNSLKKILRTTVGTLLAALLPVSGALALPAMPTSGTCAMLITNPVPEGVTVGTGAGIGPFGYNTTALLTFTSISGGTLQFYNTNVMYTSTGVYTAPASTSTGVPTITFSLSPSPDLTGAYVLSTQPGGAGSTTININLTPVNGGKTLLVQGQNQAFSGVCQF